MNLKEELDLKIKNLDGSKLLSEGILKRNREDVKKAVLELDLLLNRATNLSMRVFSEKYGKDMKEDECNGDFIYRRFKEIFGDFKENNK